MVVVSSRCVGSVLNDCASTGTPHASSAMRFCTSEIFCRRQSRRLVVVKVGNVQPLGAIPSADAKQHYSFVLLLLLLREKVMVFCASQRNERFGNGEAFFARRLLSSLFFFSVGVYCLGFLVERGHFLGEEDDDDEEEEEEEEEEEDVGVELLEHKTRTKKKKKKKKKKNSSFLPLH